MNLLAKNYIDQDGILNQELEGLVPIRYYHKLEQEFGEANEQLAQQKDYIARCDEVIKASNNEIRVRDTTIRNLSTELAKYKAGAARNAGN